jgi:hypothetical protein
MIIDFIINTFGCPSVTVLLLTSFICPFLPLIILAVTRKSINISDKNRAKELIAFILIGLYAIYACYAFMIPQALMGECGYAR